MTESSSRSPSRATLRALHADLVYLIDQLPHRVVAIRNIGRMAAEDRGCHLLTLENGDLIKARLNVSEVFQARATDILDSLTALGFSRVLARRGKATLEEWIPGEILSTLAPVAKHAALGGELLGQVHARSVGTHTTDGIERDLSWHLGQLQDSLDELHDRGHLSAEVAAKLKADTQSSVPATSEMGIVHLDFCADNMVWTDDEELVVFDNERFRDGELDFDLARCFMRWPMTASQLAAFRAAYQEHRSLDAFDAHRGFWMVCALAHSASYALHAGARNDQALDSLARWAEGGATA